MWVSSSNPTSPVWHEDEDDDGSPFFNRLSWNQTCVSGFLPTIFTSSSSCSLLFTLDFLWFLPLTWLLSLFSRECLNEWCRLVFGPPVGAPFLERSHFPLLESSILEESSGSYFGRKQRDQSGHTHIQGDRRSSRFLPLNADLLFGSMPSSWYHMQLNIGVKSAAQIVHFHLPPVDSSHPWWRSPEDVTRTITFWLFFRLCDFMLRKPLSLFPPRDSRHGKEEFPAAWKRLWERKEWMNGRIQRQ